MKVLGLLVVLFGGSLAYLVGWKCYRLGDFAQEIANFTHIAIGGHTPGVAVNPAPCPDFGLSSLAGGTAGSPAPVSGSGVASNGSVAG